MVQKLSYTANSITLGTGTSKVVLGADSGNLIVKDSDANTSILEPGLGVQGSAAVSTYASCHFDAPKTHSKSPSQHSD